MSRTVIVTGIGGSGTSALAGCLHKMGCSMGKHLARHPAGFDLYEDACLYGVFGLPEKDMRRVLTSYALTHADGDVWGWKSTLAWKAAPLLPDLYAKLGHEVRIVISHRTFRASVRARMEGRCPPGQTFTEAEATGWALRALGGMTRIVQRATCPVLHVSYEDLLADPASEVARLARFAGLEATEEAIAHVRR